MATRVIRELVDDIDGTDGDETITFAVNGQVYEIDLSEDNAKKFYEFMGPYVDNGRKMPKGSIHTPGRKAAGRAVSAPAPVIPSQPAGGSYTRLGRDQNRAIRDWARTQNDLGDIPERGRIPKHVVEAFNAAHDS